MKISAHIAILFLLVITGCSSSNTLSSKHTAWVPESVKNTADNLLPDAINGAATSLPSVVWDQWVRKNQPLVYISPKAPPIVAPTALFLPFESRVSLREGKHIAKEISRMVWQRWLSMEVLPVIEFADYTDYYSPQHAIMLARQRGADLAIGGYLTHYLAGGTVGDTNIALTLEVYDAQSGQLIWSMAHAGLMQSEFSRDYILFSAKTRLPSEPTWAIVNALATDMGTPLQSWMLPLREKEAAMQENNADAAF